LGVFLTHLGVRLKSSKPKTNTIKTARGYRSYLTWRIFS